MAQGELTLPTGTAGRATASVRLTVADGPGCDRRLEDWITVNLDPEIERPAVSLWSQIVGALPAARRPVRDAGRDRAFKSRGAWERFTVLYRRGVTVVRITDRSLVQRDDIHEWGSDLRDLIEVGNHRIILNFSKVERVGSWIVAAVVEAHRMCEGSPGGRLKVCGLAPHLREVFRIIGMGRRIVMTDDEAMAIDGPWPESAPRPLPIDILEALAGASALPPIAGGAPVEEPADARSSPSSKLGCLEGRVRLQVEVDGAEGRTLEISKRRFHIGRERGCHLRLGSSQVSKRHASIEIRDGRVFLRDLGSTNGTWIHGEPLRDDETELHDQDQFVVGPARCRLGISDGDEADERRTPIEAAETAALAIAIDGDDDDEEGESPATAELSTYDPEAQDPAARIKHEVVQGVLVVTPVLTELDDEATNEALRLRLLELAESPLPRRVVVDLEFVSRLSRRTIGVILAHHLRLDQAGGAVRVCGAHPRVTALLDQVRFTMLVDGFPTLDEAVLAAWDAPAAGRR